MRASKHPNTSSAADTPSATNSPWRLEARKKAAKEDRLRIRQMKHVAPLRRVDWTTIAHVLWRSKHCLAGIPCPAFDPTPLIRKFEKAASNPGKIPKSIASFRYMRKTRKHLIKLLKKMVASLANVEFCTFTVTNARWVLTPEQLSDLSPAKILKGFALLSDVWSPRKGGSAVMRALYLFITRH